MTSGEHSDRQLGEVTSTVRALVELMRSNSLTKIDVSVGDLSIKLRAGSVREVKSVQVVQGDAPSATTSDTASAPAGHVLTAPMIGTYYASSGPGEAPFVRPGERIEAGQTIGIIEAMKIMNEIPAERGGTVLEVLVSNAQAVEYGSPLLRISLDESAG